MSSGVYRDPLTSGEMYASGRVGLLTRSGCNDTPTQPLGIASDSSARGGGHGDGLSEGECVAEKDQTV